MLAGVLIGLACATKQYGAWYILAFIGLCIAWDLPLPSRVCWHCRRPPAYAQAGIIPTSR